MSIKEDSKEIRRAANIIWNASSDYSFNSETKAYDASGKADLYLNYIIGAVHKYYDYSCLRNFFDYLKQDTSQISLEELAWIGLENCTYKRGKAERLVLESLRRDYSKKFLDKCDSASIIDIIDEIKIAHFKRVLGEKPKMTKIVSNILNALEFDEYMNTEQIIFRMNEIIKVYFQYNYASSKDENVLKKSPKSKSLLQMDIEKVRSWRNLLLKHFGLISANLIWKISFEKNKEKRNNETFHWFKSKDEINKDERKFIQGYYGTSILQESEIKILERNLCVGNHKDCHIHFTRGDFDVNNKNAVNHRNKVLKQKEKNNAYYNENFTKNNNNILKLTNKIRNTILVNLESSCRSKAGKFEAGKAWRNLYLNDDKIFIKNFKNDFGNITVDIMLDASGSQTNRQEIIAAEGYIIAESLTRCQIPVRVYSFCSLKDYTIINLFRDYNETNKNTKIFDYNSSAYNRDGLAIRTALYMMKNLNSENKILIVLSDGKPNDMQCIPAGEINHIQYDYADAVGVNDTALEVRKGIHNGISILGVFTGIDEDVPAAKKIYGHNLVHIKSLERFADIVGIMLQNELKNIYE